MGEGGERKEEESDVKETDGEQRSELKVTQKHPSVLPQMFSVLLVLFLLFCCFFLYNMCMHVFACEFVHM